MEPFWWPWLACAAASQPGSWRRALTLERIDCGADRGKFRANNSVSATMKASGKVGEVVVAATQCDGRLRIGQIGATSGNADFPVLQGGVAAMAAAHDSLRRFFNCRPFHSRFMVDAKTSSRVGTCVNIHLHHGTLSAQISRTGRR